MAGYAAALSVMTLTGVRLVVPMARSKNRRAALTSRRDVTNTSMTWPNWSIARVDVAPAPGDLHIRLVRLPAVADGLAAGPGCVSQQWREPLHPSIDRDVVDLDPALGE